MRMLTQIFIITVVLAVTSACTLGNIQSEAHAVELQTAADIADCKLLGTTIEKTRDRWVPSRTDKKIANELLTLARNKAINTGGNTLVEETKLIMGRQTFTIYNCP